MSHLTRRQAKMLFEERDALRAEMDRLKASDRQAGNDLRDLNRRIREYDCEAQDWNRTCTDAEPCVCHRLKARAEKAEVEVKRLTAALAEAAQSLESASRPGRVESDDVRAYCLSRASVARAALAGKDGGK